MISYKIIKNTYVKLKSYEKTANHLGIGKYHVEKALKGSSVVIPCGGRNKYNLDEDFFVQNTPESFYWAGFIAADGCVLNGKKTLSIGIRDSGHLDKLKKCIKFDGKVKEYENNGRPIYTFTTWSSKVVKDLERFNITERKSLTYIFPDWLMDHPLVNHFMRGYSDGDGCFYEWKGKNLNITQFGFNVVGTKQFITTYRNILSKNCNLDENKTVRRNGNVYVISYCGNRLVPKIRDFLYKDSTTDTRLDRKHDVAFSEKNTNLPECFNYSPVIGKRICDNKIIKFVSLKEAQIAGFNRTCITDCCRGRQKTHKGYIWKYAEKENDIL